MTRFIRTLFLMSLERPTMSFCRPIAGCIQSSSFEWRGDVQKLELSLMLLVLIVFWAYILTSVCLKMVKKGRRPIVPNRTRR